MAGFIRNSTTEVNAQPVAIMSVDLAGGWASGRTRTGTELPINISHSVGAVLVTPTLGEQWYIEKVDGIYRLKAQIPFNAAHSNDLTQGQVQVGSTGPLQLNGKQINANAPLRISPYTTTGRPDPSLVDAGTMIFDLTLSQPLWSNGTDWVDATGSTV